MAKKIYYVDIDLNKNEIKNVVVDSVNALPTGKEGQIVYFNITGEKQFYFYNGSGWQLMGAVQDIVKSDPITVVNAAGNYTIGITNVTTTQDGAMTAADKVRLDSMNIWDDDQDVPHIAIPGSPLITGATVNAALSSVDSWLKAHVVATARPHGELKQTDKDNDPLLAANSDDNVASQKAIKTYVDGKIAGSGRPAQAYDPTTTSAYPVLANGIGGVIKLGDQFIITGPGTVGAITVKAGDIFLAKKDLTDDTNGTVGTQNPLNWDEIIGATTLPDATESVKGVATLATQAEVNAGTVTDEIVTPATLKGYMGVATNKRAEIKSVSGKSPLNLSHNFNTTDVVVSCYTGTGVEIDADIAITTNSVSASLNDTALTFSLVVTGIQS